jgi:hypothetical protein
MLRSLLLGATAAVTMRTTMAMADNKSDCQFSKEPNSLLTGKITGNFAKSALKRGPFLQERPVPQPFLSQFPAEINRENIYENREIFPR